MPKRNKDGDAIARRELSKLSATVSEAVKREAGNIDASFNTADVDRKAAVDAAIASDVLENVKAKQSGAEVAIAFDTALTGINWAAFKGNASASKCGMDILAYKLVKLIRGNYRDAWNEAELPNFDQRWKYVQSCSEHYVAPDGSDRAAKSTEEKLMEAVRAVFRHATTLDDEYLIGVARDACSHLGLEIKDESGE